MLARDLRGAGGPEAASEAGWHVGLLRGVNVGGRRPVAMADLRKHLGEAGLLDVTTLLQSGNVAFRDRGRAPADLELFLEETVRSRLLLETAFFVRTAEEWSGVIARNPFRNEAERDPAHLVVVLLKRRPDAAAVASLEAAISGREAVRVQGREAYVVYPDGIGTSRLTNAVIERRLGGLATARNWNTVLKLGGLAPPRLA